ARRHRQGAYVEAATAMVGCERHLDRRRDDSLRLHSRRRRTAEGGPAPQRRDLVPVAPISFEAKNDAGGYDARKATQADSQLCVAARATVARAASRVRRFFSALRRTLLDGSGRLGGHLRPPGARRARDRL